MALLTKREVCERLKISLAHLGRLENDPAYAHMGFPKRIQIGFRVLYPSEDMDSWIQGLIDRR
ncbi:hypothetical protein SCH01S_14_00310 [Sphingomonas changbaiensis NBRC 104936]|uniref:Helix-turn-helix domain-containing protein n=1 Tax=Sphingomonas changbaiensis NBRC 104936 TaxID=1219043 RepID=A0A0E9MLU0_9SPHN|nr:hypothetical protein SCH01S_14_00310 [Sphingomonas changbaiensis NBRC 104936]